MHLTEESYQRLLAGEEFPGSDELASHLEAPCTTCEAFLSGRRPDSLPGLRGTPVSPTAATQTLAQPGELEDGGGPLPLLRPDTPPRGTAPESRMLRRPPGRLARAMRTENLAIVFTDIKGFTERTSRQTRAENERLLQIHEELMLPVFKAFGGQVRKSIGDAYLVTFESPTNAVLCGAAIQDRLSAFNQTAPEADRIEVRVAINIGEVRVEANDVFGEPVNVASRIEGIAEAGEVFFTEAVYLVMNKAEVPSVEVGSFELKGVPERVRVFKVPRGPYRLTSGAFPANGAGPAQASLPYGGLGLSRAGGLPTPDIALIERALVARQSRRALVARANALVRESFGGATGAKVALGVGGVAVVVGLVVLANFLSTPKVERLIEGGELAQANALISTMAEGPERTFWEARVDERQHHYGDAVNGYVDVAKSSPGLVKRAIDRMGLVAQTADCSVKVRVANALGDLGESYGKSVLEALSKEKPQSGGFLNLGRCDPHAAAEAALKKLEAR